MKFILWIISVMSSLLCFSYRPLKNLIPPSLPSIVKRSVANSSRSAWKRCQNSFRKSYSYNTTSPYCMFLRRSLQLFILNCTVTHRSCVSLNIVNLIEKYKLTVIKFYPAFSKIRVKKEEMRQTFSFLNQTVLNNNFQNAVVWSLFLLTT